MYDDLLGDRPEEKKKTPGGILGDGKSNAKPADPKKYPSHAPKTTDGGSVSSCSDSGVEEGCDGDCGHCADDCEAPKEVVTSPKPTIGNVPADPKPDPKDPWSNIGADAADPLDDSGDIDWDENDCCGDCDNCNDEECQGIDDMLGDFFEDDDDDGEGSWVK